MPENKIEESLLVTFGILADVQYADEDDVVQYGRTRFYRSSFENLQRALFNWKNENKFTLILQLGDLIDGTRSVLSGNYHECLDKVLKLFKTHNFNKVFHIWGNHEVYAFNRKYLIESVLNTAKELNQATNINYYFYDLTDRLRIICLDEYELSVLGYDKDDEIFKYSHNLLKEKIDLNNKIHDEDEKHYFKRYQKYNGGISDTQLEWLKDQLEFCNKNDKKIIIAGHIPLLSKAGDFSVVWNSDDILKLIWSYDNLVLAYVAGHYHPGGYYLDKKNIHHLTLNAILETKLESDNSFVTVYVYENRIYFKNQINERSFEIFY